MTSKSLHWCQWSWQHIKSILTLSPPCLPHGQSENNRRAKTKILFGFLPFAWAPERTWIKKHSVNRRVVIGQRTWIKKHSVNRRVVIGQRTWIKKHSVNRRVVIGQRTWIKKHSVNRRVVIGQRTWIKKHSVNSRVVTGPSDYRLQAWWDIFQPRTLQAGRWRG